MKMEMKCVASFALPTRPGKFEIMVPLEGSWEVICVELGYLRILETVGPSSARVPCDFLCVHGSDAPFDLPVHFSYLGSYEAIHQYASGWTARRWCRIFGPKCRTRI